jgi:hypothetical protein
MLFIEKQPEEVKIGLYNLAVHNWPTIHCDGAAEIPPSSRQRTQPALERRMERNLLPLPKPRVGLRIALATLDRKATDGSCSLCESKRVK